MKEYFDKWAETYSRGENPLFQQWNIDKLFEQIELKDDDVVLDLGTGNGKLLREVGKRDFVCRLIGIDFSKEMLDEAREKLKQENLNAQLIQRTLPDIGLKKESIDYVISNIALHHVKDKKKLYSAIYNVLKKNGLLYAEVPFEKKQKAPNRWGHWYFFETFENFLTFLPLTIFVYFLLNILAIISPCLSTNSHRYEQFYGRRVLYI